MIKSPQEYLFVDGDNATVANPHGDLARIMMNGKILPTLAQDEKPWKVRGEDVAFLLEAACERLAVANNEYPPVRGDHATFSRYRSAAQMKGIISLLESALVFKGADEGWLKPAELLLDDHVWPDMNNPLHSLDRNLVDPSTALAGTFLTKNEMTSDKKDFYVYARLNPNEIMKIYSDVRSMDRFCLSFQASSITPSLSSYSPDYYTISGTITNPNAYTNTYSFYNYVYQIERRDDDGDGNYSTNVVSDATIKLRTIDLLLSADNLNFVDENDGDLELWALLSAYDHLQERTYSGGPETVTSFILLNLGKLDSNSCRDGKITFSTKLFKDRIDDILAFASDDCPYKGSLRPFARHFAWEFPAHTEGMFVVFSTHYISIWIERIYLHARLRDRTRWQTPNDNQ